MASSSVLITVDLRARFTEFLRKHLPQQLKRGIRAAASGQEAELHGAPLGNPRALAGVIPVGVLYPQRVPEPRSLHG